MSIDVAAKPATVFRGLVESRLLSEWLSAKATIEPRVGGRVRIDFGAHDTVVEGEVSALERDRLLAFTWGVTGGALRGVTPAGSTRVTVRLDPTRTGTRVPLPHEGLPS